MGTVKINQHIPLTLKENPIQILLQHTIVRMIYKILALALFATIISINKNEAKKWKHCDIAKYPCAKDISEFCCERPDNVWKPELKGTNPNWNKGKKVCCEFPEKHTHLNYIKPEPCYSQCITKNGIDKQKGQDKKCREECTRGLREPCAKNEDCHKWNKKMICLKKRKVVDTSEDGKKVSSYVHEIIPGQCRHGLPTIVELAKSTPTLSNFTDVLEKAGLVATLNGNGPFTVFAPSNKAFAQIPQIDYANLLNPENAENLKKKLLNHVVAGKYDSTQFHEGNEFELSTKGEKKITVQQTQSKILIKSSKHESEIITSDIEASNGIIHIIHNVL